MRLLQCLLLFLLVLPGSAHADQKGQPNYAKAVESIKLRRSALAKEWRTNPSAALEGKARDELLSAVQELSDMWLGTRWALGAPQTKTPQVGKVNCGTFVGRVLHDVGFQVAVKKLQRQPSQLIIKSFVSDKRVRKFSNTPMKKFLASVREMGPGLFIIGLDFHVGFLLQTDTDLRFIHASYETQTVINESAASAYPIVSSGYRVIRKILSPTNLRHWLAGDSIAVKGHY